MSNILNKKNITTDDWIEHYEWQVNNYIDFADTYGMGDPLSRRSLESAVYKLESALRERRLHILEKHCE